MLRLRSLAGVVPLLLIACESPHKVPIPAPAEEPEPEIAVETAQTAKVATVAPTAKSPEKPVERFAEPPSMDRRTLAHILEPKARIGAYLGLPDGWRNDDPSYLLFFPEGKDPKPPARAVAMTLFEDGLVDANRARVLRKGAKPTGLRDARWDAWKPEVVGKGRYPAMVAHGTGRSVRGAEGARSAIAVVVDIPDAPALGFVGSWASAEPQHEAAVLDMLRAIERCQVEVGRGCVTPEERKRAAL